MVQWYPCHSELIHKYNSSYESLLLFLSSVQDVIICIASLHHLATIERRLEALQEMARVLRPGGKMLVYVWALEQPSDTPLYRNANLKYLSTDCRQDVLVPWSSADGTTHQRYYHLFRKGELEELLDSVDGLEFVFNGYDRDKWYASYRKKVAT